MGEAMNKIKIPKQIKRSHDVVVERQSEGKDGRILTISFASEEPYERWWGVEILSMKSGAMIMDRLETGAPLLFNHNRDLHIGTVLKVWLENGKAYAEVKFSNSGIGREKLEDVQDGILTKVSFGYQILDMELIREKKDAPAEYLVTSYLPFEISMVTIPADNTVGVGRSDEDQSDEMIEIEVKSNAEDKKNLTDIPVVEKTVEMPASTEKIINVVTENNERNFTMDHLEIAKQQAERVAAINKIARDHDMESEAQGFISDPSKKAADFALFVMEKRGGKFTPIKDQALDLTEKEKKHYSIARALNAIVNGDLKKAGFEYECHLALQKQLGRETKGFFMPINVETRAPNMASVAAQGGNLVQTNLLGGQFIDVLRNRAVVMKAGARQLTGLSGNIQIPRKNGRSAIYWVSENGTITESEVTFDQVAFAPKTIGALSVYTQQLLAQASLDVDALITNDLYEEVALGIDAAALTGSGTGGQPTGLKNLAGIQSVSLGTNGAAPTMDLAIDLETAIADLNADVDNMSFLFNAKTIGALKKLKSTTGEYLWRRDGKGTKAGSMGIMEGYDVFRTNQLPKNLSKGAGTNLSMAVFGDFSQLVVAQWGAGIEVVANPYGSQFAKGGVEVRAMALVDVNVRLKEAFSICTDIVA